MNKLNIFLFFLLLLPTAAFAQSQDFGIWSSVGLERKSKKWDFNTEFELRTKDNSSQVDRWSLELGTAYNLFKPLKAGLSYQAMYYHDTRYWDFQPRNRFNFFIQGRQKLGNFSFSLRERIQVTIKDDSDRIKKSREINTYKINPEWIWRNRLNVSYNIPEFPVNPSVAFETFYQLNNPDGNVFSDLRYTFSLNYKPGKHHAFELYELIDREINVSDPVHRFITGIGYVYSF